MSTAPAFWTKAARKYAASPISNPDNYNDTLTRTRAHLSPGDHLLELGCGTGPTALALAGSVAQVTATDFAAGMVEIANERLAEVPVTNVTFRTATIAEACADGPYDAIAGFNLLHLVKDIDDALAAIHDGLKPGGVFISKSACVASRSPIMWPLIKVMQVFGRAPYIRWFTTGGLKRRIERAGFTIIEEHTYGGFAPTLFLVARRQ
ncbi:class I SAM-dependent methyltransferase [Pseudaestuariivita atlantica]|uniref:Methyltransferase domain-containing protein n=1 Tax=Pseudaestuariivita atlantica TaxID=1317121 RepID=A0A0L1JP79_9RHOB|nr:class I SAM-dependent methyltransferase [Pseudaestuariivita atlantica]KNG93223.1 hypothetical protein ATO11_12245 [Pseudaestuariivita atlantica]